MVQEGRWLVDDGAYKLHLVDEGLFKIKELPNLLLKDYRNNFPLLTDNENTAVAPDAIVDIETKKQVLQKHKRGISSYEEYEQTKSYIDKLQILLLELRRTHPSIQYTAMSKSLLKELSKAQREIVLFLTQPHEQEAA